MKNRSQFSNPHLFFVSFVLFASLILFAGQAMAQNSQSTSSRTTQSRSDASMEDATYQCLAKKFIKIKEYAAALGTPDRPETTLQRDPSDHTRAFDPDSGRNFHYDKKYRVWRDTKTGKAETPTNLEDALYCCLASKFMTIKRYAPALGTPDRAETTLQRDPSDHTRAFDPESGRNFAWDKKKQAWIDVKTGKCICPAACYITSTATTQPTPTPTPTPETSGVNPNAKPFASRGGWAIGVGFEYVRANDEPAKNLNGFNTQLFYNFTPHIGAGGDIGCAFGSDQIGTTTDSNLHRCTFLFGPQFTVHPNDKVEIFFQPLIGVTHDSTKVTTGTLSTDSSASAFTISFGGGLDVNVSKHIVVRPFHLTSRRTSAASGNATSASRRASASASAIRSREREQG